MIRRLRGQNQISHLAINLGTINAAAEGSAVDVLLYLNAVHQFRGQILHIAKKVALDRIGHPGGCTGTDGEKEQICSPVFQFNR